MKKHVVSGAFWIATVIAAFASPAFAGLSYDSDQTPDGLRFVMISGEFSFEDNLDEFAAIVRSHNPSLIGFDSPGGNVVKAMELGRLIRSFRLNTLQPKGPDCSSACALAFLGGVMRWSEPGAIGVHKSSFSGDTSLTMPDAVSAVQHMTAEVITYMIEMGVDPALLQLSLRYDSDDMRYLSKSEMEQYRVISGGGGQQTVQSQPPTNTSPSPQTASLPSPSAQDRSVLAIPEARSGRVRHPKGTAPVKARPDGKSANLVNLRNGSTISILDNVDRWYHVRAGSRTGYMHHTWVFVDQYDSGPFAQRHIQIASFNNLAEAESYVRSASIPLAAQLATNGWFAVTLRQTYDERMAANLVRELKKQGSIPGDAFMTYGNTYVREVCCR